MLGNDISSVRENHCVIASVPKRGNSSECEFRYENALELTFVVFSSSNFSVFRAVYEVHIVFVMRAIISLIYDQQESERLNYYIDGRI